MMTNPVCHKRVVPLHILVLPFLLIASTSLVARQTVPAKPPIENLHRLTPQLFSGGEPQDDAAFAQLAQMDVKTIVSVDGARPDVSAARKHGIRYVHIPIGYDGVDATAQAALTRVVHEAQEPVFVHCHHGKHRGPAAAAVACMAAGKMTNEQATEFLKLAGTSKEYVGLWRDVAAFRPLPADAALPPLAETAEIESLPAAMAQLDRAWDGLKLCRDAGWKTPPHHADLTAARQSLLVWEGLKESRRTLAAERLDLAKQLDTALAQAEQLHQSIQSGAVERAAGEFRRLEAACNRCHEQYRN